MRFPRILAVAALGAIGLAACGSSGYSSGSHAARAPGAQAAAPTSQAAVTTGNTSLGSVLVDANGLTLYGRTTDMNGMSSCTGACATAWPPLTVSSSALPAGLDAKIFSVIARPDGSFQLRAGKWPLYRFAGDGAPGAVNGQGTANFFAVAPTGKLIKSAS
jgi:predicted lipoprotein with Yx(FWY)xxD motif